MPDEVVTQSGSTDTTVAPVVSATVVAPVPPAPAPANGDPAWLAPRLEQARRNVLKELGVENIDDIKSSIAELNAKREASKTADQKAADATTKLASVEAKSAKMQQVIGSLATARMASLTEDQRNAVAAIAGDDPVSQIDAIEKLTPTWSRKPAPVVQAAIADTAPSKGQPEPVTTTVTNTHHAEWQALKAKNPILADRYMLQYREQIFGRPAT